MTEKDLDTVINKKNNLLKIKKIEINVKPKTNFRKPTPLKNKIVIEIPEDARSTDPSSRGSKEVNISPIQRKPSKRNITQIVLHKNVFL